MVTLWQVPPVSGKSRRYSTNVVAFYEEAEYLPSFRWENDILVISGGKYDGYTVLQISGIPGMSYTNAP